MAMTEEGLSRLRGMESQAHYFYEILSDIEDRQDLLPQEYFYLKDASEFFDTILFGAGDLNAKLRNDTSLSLNDFFIVFNHAKKVLPEINTLPELQKEFQLFKGIMLFIYDKRQLPNTASELEVFTKLKKFLHNYSDFLSKSLDLVLVEI